MGTVLQDTCLDGVILSKSAAYLLRIELPMLSFKPIMLSIEPIVLSYERIVLSVQKMKVLYTKPYCIKCVAVAYKKCRHLHCRVHRSRFRPNACAICLIQLGRLLLAAAGLTMGLLTISTLRS